MTELKIKTAMDKRLAGTGVATASSDEEPIRHDTFMCNEEQRERVRRKVIKVR